MRKFKIFFSKEIDFMMSFLTQYTEPPGNWVLAQVFDEFGKFDKIDAEAKQIVFNKIDSLVNVPQGLVYGAIEIAAARIEAGERAGFSLKQSLKGL